MLLPISTSLGTLCHAFSDTSGVTADRRLSSLMKRSSKKQFALLIFANAHRDFPVIFIDK